MYLHARLDSLAATKPGADFAIQNGRRLTYGQATEEAGRLAQALIDANLRNGDRVAVLALNSIEYALLYYAASKAGVVLVPLNYRLAPPEWSFILNDAGTRIRFAGRAFLPLVDGIRAELPTIDEFVALDAEAAGWTCLGAWTSQRSGSDVNPRYAGDTPVVQMYTSGTTGSPKGVVLTHASLIALAEACVPWLENPPFGRYLLTLPMFHIFGAAVILTAPLMCGALFIMRECQPAAVVCALREERIAVAAMVPSMIQACLNQPDSAAGGYQALRRIIYGASPISEGTLRRAMDVFQCEFVQGYGMTEIAPLTGLSPDVIAVRSPASRACWRQQGARRSGSSCRSWTCMIS